MTTVTSQSRTNPTLFVSTKQSSHSWTSLQLSCGETEARIAVKDAVEIHRKDMREKPKTSSSWIQLKTPSLRWRVSARDDMGRRTARQRSNISTFSAGICGKATRCVLTNSRQFVVTAPDDATRQKIKHVQSSTSPQPACTHQMDNLSESNSKSKSHRTSREQLPIESA